MKGIIIRLFRKLVLPVFVSIVMGCLCGHVIYNIYTDNKTIVFSNNIVYLLQTGVYSDYNNMRVNSVSNDYVYYEEDGFFKTIIGITTNKDNVNKIKKAYGKDIVVNKYLINNLDLYNKIKSFDDKISKESDNKKINDLVISMLNIYKDNLNIELAPVQ